MKTLLSGWLHWLELAANLGALQMVCTDDQTLAHSDGGAIANVSYRGSTYSLSPHSVSLVQILPSGAGGPVLLDTSKGACAASQDVAPNATYPLGKDGPRLLSSHYASAGWEYFSEVAADWRSRYNRTSVSGPLEQLNLTDNDSDYLWLVGG